MDGALLKNGERLDDLQYGGLWMIQRPDAFCFGTDEVLLSDFARFRRGDRVVDLGTGTGILPLLMSARNPGVAFDAIELREDMADIARRNMALNALSDTVRVHVCDFVRAPEILGRARCQAVVCNPPYARACAGKRPEKDAVYVAKQETERSITDVCAVAAALLQNGGRFSVVFPAARMPELMRAMTDHRLAPKRLRAVLARYDRAPKVILVEGVKNARDGLMWHNPLILANPDGSPSEEYLRIYHLPS